MQAPNVFLTALELTWFCNNSSVLMLFPVLKLLSFNGLFNFCKKAEKTTMSKDYLPSDEVIIVYELMPTPEQKALAGFLKLPSTFFCYKNKPGYVSDEDDGKECQN